MISIDQVFVWWSYGPGRCIKVDVCIFTSSAIWDEWYIVLGWRDASNHTLNYLVTLLSEHYTEPQRPNLDCPFCCWKIARFCRVQHSHRQFYFFHWMRSFTKPSSNSESWAAEELLQQMPRKHLPKWGVPKNEEYARMSILMGKIGQIHM